MSNFNFYLEGIASNIISPKYSDEISDFVTVKDYVLDIMRSQDSYFRKICQNDILYGSASHNIRIHNDDEFDVLMELRFPCYSQIIQHELESYPGYAYLDFSEANIDGFIANKLARNNKQYLNRGNLKNWLHNIFLNAFDNFGTTVWDAYDNYELSYKWRGITYTVYAKSENREFSIDFVPAIKIVRPNSKTWFAIPKGVGNNGNFTYMISNAQAEARHVERGGETLRDALCLLQALRDAKNLPKLRPYHMVTVAIWIARTESYGVFDSPLSHVFLLLLSDLCDAFAKGSLSYAWDPFMNLLSGFQPDELAHYENTLNHAYNTLKSYNHQPNLTYRRCLEHFQD